jgi:hypothetical protein
MINITPAQLRKAADLKEKIQSLQEELGQLLGGEVATPAQLTKAPKKKRKISAAGIARIVAATKARWAKVRAAKGGAATAPRPKRKFSAQAIANIRAGVAKRMAAQGKAVRKPKIQRSAAWKAAISAAAKARWAKAKAAGRSRL